jgi:hypothetical protein
MDLSRLWLLRRRLLVTQDYGWSITDKNQKAWDKFKVTTIARPVSPTGNSRALWRLGWFISLVWLAISFLAAYSTVWPALCVAGCTVMLLVNRVGRFFT